MAFGKPTFREHAQAEGGVRFPRVTRVETVRDEKSCQLPFKGSRAHVVRVSFRMREHNPNPTALAVNCATSKAGSTLPTVRSTEHV